jgi:hypothetical protein
MENVTGAIGSAVRASESSIDGSWSVIDGTANQRCHIEKEATSGYRMVLREKISATVGTNASLKITSISLTTLLAGLTITDSSQWFIARLC